MENIEEASGDKINDFGELLVEMAYGIKKESEVTSDSLER